MSDGRVVMSAAAREPESIGQLLALVGKQLAKSLPMRLVVAGVVLLGTWILHTYLLVGPNGGFAPNDSSLFSGFSASAAVLGQTLALTGRVLGGSVFWFMLSLTVSTLISGLRRPGGGFVSRLGSVPSTIGSSFAPRAMPGLMLGAGLGCFVAGAVDNRFAALLMAIATLFAIAAGDADFSHLILRCVYNDGRRALGKPKRRLASTGADAFLVGFCLSSLVFGLAFLLPAWLFLVLGVALLVVAAVVSQNAPAVAGAAGVLVALLLFAGARIALADDGGWVEAGGTLWGWLTSEGAAQAAVMGITPGIAAALGAIVGVLGPEMGDLFVAGILPTLAGGPGANPGLVYDTPAGAFNSCSPTGLPHYSVDTQSCGLSVSDVLARYGGVGPSVDLAFSWSLLNPDSAFGRGWAFAYESSITLEDGAPVLRSGSGQGLRFEAAPAAAGAPPAFAAVGNAGIRLTAASGAYSLTERGFRETRRFDIGPDGAFRLAYVTDTLGNSVAVARDTSGRITSVTDASGRSTSLEYDAGGRCATVTMPDGRRATYEYTPAGDLARVVDLGGVEILYGHEADGSIAWICVGRERKTVRFEWVDAPEGRRVASVTDAAGGVTRYEVVSDSPRVVRVTDAEGLDTTYRSEGGRTAEILTPGGARGSVARDTAGVAVATQSAGGSVRTERDPDGRWLRTTDAAGLTRTIILDANGDVVREDGPTGSVVREYDAARLLTSVTSPGGRRWAYEYDRRGLLVAVTDPAGGVVRLTQDLFGNPTSLTDQAGATRRFEWDETGMRLVSSVEPSGAQARYEHDGNGRVTRVTFPDGSTSSTMYDCCTDIAYTDRSGRTRGVDRDAALRPTRVGDGIDFTDITYDRVGRTVRVQDSGGSVASITNDDDGRPVRIETPSGVMECAFDARGRLVWRKDEAGAQAWLAWDAAGRPVSVTDSLGFVQKVGYDEAGRLSRVVNARGQESVTALDPDGFETSRTVDGRVVAEFQHDGAGRIVAIKDTTGEQRWEADATGRVTAIRYGDGAAATFEYGPAGAPTRIVYPGGLAVTIDYDSMLLQTKVAWDGGWVSFGYDPSGDLKSENRSNGVASEYVSDRDRRTRRIAHRSGSRDVAVLTSRYGPGGRIVEESGTLPIAPGSAPPAVVATYDAAGRLATMDGAPCASDEDGNLISMAGRYSAAYDPSNRMTGLRTQDSVTRMTYDGLGRLAAVETGGSVRRHYRDTSGRLLAEADAEGRVISWYVYRDLVLVARVDADGSAHFYHGDRSCSVVAVTDAKGRVEAARAYDPWGTVTASEGDTRGFAFGGLVGILELPEGLYLTPWRTYDPKVGRFLQRDPVSLPLGRTYAYASGDPVDRIDPAGLADAGPVGGFDPQKAAMQRILAGPSNPLGPIPDPNQTFISAAPDPHQTFISAVPDPHATYLRAAPPPDPGSITQGHASDFYDYSHFANAFAQWGYVGYNVATKGATALSVLTAIGAELGLCAAAATPIGWGAVATTALLAFTLSRVPYGITQVQEGLNGDKFDSADIIASPGTRSTVCNVASAVASTPGAIKDSLSNMYNGVQNYLGGLEQAITNQVMSQGWPR
jgi:RHS repeat-associated protein